MPGRVEIYVLGEPKGQPRARSTAFMSKAGKMTSRVYDPGTADGWKYAITAEAAKNCGGTGTWMTDGPVALQVLFRMPRPARLNTKKALAGMTAPFHRHVSKPDLDNLLKAVMDALTPIGIWKDDAQVWKIEATKRYAGPAEMPGANITVVWE